MQLCITMEVAVAIIEYGVTITSSPGSKSKEATAACSPAVADWMAIACLTF